MDVACLGADLAWAAAQPGLQQGELRCAVFGWLLNDPLGAPLWG